MTDSNSLLLFVLAFLHFATVSRRRNEGETFTLGGGVFFIHATETNAATLIPLITFNAPCDLTIGITTNKTNTSDSSKIVSTIQNMTKFCKNVSNKNHTYSQSAVARVTIQFGENLTRTAAFALEQANISTGVEYRIMCPRFTTLYCQRSQCVRLAVDDGSYSALPNVVLENCIVKASTMVTATPSAYGTTYRFAVLNAFEFVGVRNVTIRNVSIDGAGVTLDCTTCPTWANAELNFIRIIRSQSWGVMGTGYQNVTINSVSILRTTTVNYSPISFAFTVLITVVDLFVQNVSPHPKFASLTSVDGGCANFHSVSDNEANLTLVNSTFMNCMLG
eukprot:PhF_6_TR26682/c0_g1_i1/m.38836